MSIDYPLPLPASLVSSAQRVTMRQFARTSVSESVFTGQQTGHIWAQHWEMDVALRPMRRSAAGKWIAFLAALYGAAGTFLAGDPTYGGPQGVATGAPLVMGASQTGRTLVTDGWTAGVTGILKAGDLFQLGSGAATRLHMALTDANSDGSGVSTLDVWPDLREAPADNAPLTLSSPLGLWRLAQPVVEAGFEPFGNDADGNPDPLVLIGFSAREGI